MARALPGRRCWVVLGALLSLAALAAGIAAALKQGGLGRGTTPVSTLVPAMPTTLAGYQRSGPPTTVTQRVFEGQPNYLDNFPWTTNACASTKNTTQWRSLVPDDVVAGDETDQHGSTTLRSRDAKSVTTGRAGLIVGDGCQEPVFFLVRSPVGDTLVDVAVTTQHWTAAP
jgi:hypothetical protein